MTKTLRTLCTINDRLTAIAYRPDATKTITFREWDELLEQAEAWGAVRIRIPGDGWLVKFQDEWYWL